jgi:hypothetical protein
VQYLTLKIAKLHTALALLRMMNTFSADRQETLQKGLIYLFKSKEAQF